MWRRLLMNHYVWLFGFWLVLFAPLFMGRVPFPGDLMVGAYEPWVGVKGDFYTNGTVKNIELSDTFSQLYLWKQLAAEQWSQGVWPFWNIYSLTGNPLLANPQAGVLFPTIWLWVLLGEYWGWGLHVSLALLIAMWGMYWFLGLLKLSPTSRLAGAVVFGVGGLMTTWMELGMTTWGLALLVWSVGLMRAWMVEKSWWAWWALPWILGALVLSGHSQVVVFSMIVLVSYALFLGWQSRDLKRFGLLLVPAGMGIGLIGVQLAVTGAFLGSSIRNLDPVHDLYTEWLVGGEQMIRYTMAYFWGNVVKRNEWSGEYFMEVSVFVGTVSIPVVSGYLIAGKKRAETWFWIGVVLLGWVMALDSVVSQWIWSWEISWLTFSSASRWLMVSGVGMAVLVGLGFDSLEQSRRVRQWMVATAIGIGLGVVITWLLWWLGDRVGHDQVMVSVKNSVISLGVLGLVVILGMASRWINRQKLVWILLLILVVDLGFYFQGYTPFVKSELVYPTTDDLTWLMEHADGTRIARENTNLLPPNTWMAYGLESIEGYNPLNLLSYSKWFRLAEGGDYGTGPSRYLTLSFVDPAWLRMANVGYFLSVKDESSDLGQRLSDGGYALAQSDGVMQIWEAEAMPRWWIPERVWMVSDESRGAQRMMDENFAPMEEVVIWPLDGGENLSQAEMNGNGSVEAWAREGNDVVAQVSMESHGVVVLSEAWDVGWSVMVDEVEAEALRVNGAFRGVMVPAGSHQVRWTYIPEGFEQGWMLTRVSMLVWLLVGVGLAGRTYIRKNKTVA